MSCGRSALRAASPATPKARCWSSSATRACCAPPVSRTASRRFCAARARAGSRPNTACCRARPTLAARAKRRAASKAGARQEIQRLIGRSLRAVVDLEALGERTVTLDCDVLQADGGTRTAAITGAYVALARGLREPAARGGCWPQSAARPDRRGVGGHRRGVPVLDLDYAEDSQAETDMNVVMNNGGAFVEIQGTAEGHAFRRHELDALLDLAAAASARSSRCSCRRSTLG